MICSQMTHTKYSKAVNNPINSLPLELLQIVHCFKVNSLSEQGPTLTMMIFRLYQALHKLRINKCFGKIGIVLIK